MVILARILSPTEMGTYVVVMAVVGLGNTLREFGLPAYLIHKPELSEHSIRTAFTITFCASAAIAIILMQLRGFVAGFYGEPLLAQGIVVGASSFLLLPVSVMVTALLQREMAFGVVAICNLWGNSTAAISSVLLATLGCGFMAPVWGVLAGNAALAVACLCFRPNLRFLKPSLRDWRAVLCFGSYSSVSGIINALNLLAPHLILARVLDLAAAGMYSRATMITQMLDKLVLDVIRPVIFPAISERFRTGGDLKGSYLQAVEHLAALHWPFLLFVALMASPLVELLLGAQWLEIVPLVRMLALASLALFPVCLMYPILVSIGRVRDVLTAALIVVPLSLFVTFVASFFGIKAVAASAFLTAPLQFYVAVSFVRRRIPFQLSEFAAATQKGMVAAACATLGPVGTIVANGMDLDVSILSLPIAVLVAGAAWWLGLIATSHPLAGEISQAMGRAQSGRPPMIRVKRLALRRRRWA